MRSVNFRPKRPSNTSYLNIYAIIHCFEQEVIPSELKIFEVVPIFEKGDKSVLGNCRPISFCHFSLKSLKKSAHCNFTLH